MKEIYLNKKYDEVINTYLRNKNTCSEEDCFYAISSLHKTGKYAAALRAYKDTLARFPGHTMSGNVAASAMYKEMLKTFDKFNVNIESFLKQVDYALSICPEEELYPRIELTEIARDALGYNIQDKTRRYELMEHYLNMVSPSELSEEVRQDYSFGFKSRKESMKEKWFKDCSHMLYETGRYEECIDICDKALRELTNYCYTDGDIDFIIRKARALGKLSRFDEAISLLDSVEPYYQHWYTYFSYMEVYADMGDVKRTLWAVSKGSFFRYDHWRRVIFYDEVVATLLRLGETEIAKLHAMLIIRLYEDNKFEPPVDYSSMFPMDDLSLACTFSTEEILAKLTPIWTKYAGPAPKYLYGHIAHLPDEYDTHPGNISGADFGHYLFFRSDFMGDIDQLKEGTLVRFEKTDREDTVDYGEVLGEGQSLVKVYPYVRGVMPVSR